MKAPIAAFLLVLAASCALAQTVAPELAPAAAKYKADMATLDAQRLAALAQAQKSHAAALDASEKTATAAGNLPVVAAITKERESLVADTLTPSFPDGLPKNLQTTRKAYLDTAANIRVNEATRRAAIGAEYLRALASLQAKAAANPELAQQIATEKGKLLATAPVASTTAKPSHSATKPDEAEAVVAVLGTSWKGVKGSSRIFGRTVHFGAKGAVRVVHDDPALKDYGSWSWRSDEKGRVFLKCGFNEQEGRFKITKNGTRGEFYWSKVKCEVELAAK